jgi:hypothetical protein
MSKDKFISEETKKELKKLEEYKVKISNYSTNQAKKELLNTGIYTDSGKLKSYYK